MNSVYDGGTITSVTNAMPAKGLGPNMNMANRASAGSACKMLLDFYDIKIKGIGH